MVPLNPAEANDLAGQFFSLARAISDFRYRHWNELSSIQHKRLADSYRNLLSNGEDMLALSTTLVLAEAGPSLVNILSITSTMKVTLDSLNDLKMGIELAAMLVTLGRAIVSGDIKTIGSTVASLSSK